MARILSIEDDADLQHLLSRILGQEGYDVHYAFTGLEGYEKALALSPDLIILDMMLPLMNGVELIGRLKQHKTAKEIPVIVMTAYSADAQFVESSLKALGVVEYIRKPVRIRELLSLVKQVLAKAGKGSSPGARTLKGAVRLDAHFRSVWIDDKLVATLPIKRFETLQLLARREGGVSRQELVRKIWGPRGNENSLEKTIQRLREDFGPAQSWRIRTTLNGYELVGDAALSALPLSPGAPKAGAPPAVLMGGRPR